MFGLIWFGRGVFFGGSEGFVVWIWVGGGGADVEEVWGFDGFDRWEAGVNGWGV